MRRMSSPSWVPTLDVLRPLAVSPTTWSSTPTNADPKTKASASTSKPSTNSTPMDEPASEHSSKARSCATKHAGPHAPAELSGRNARLGDQLNLEVSRARVGDQLSQLTAHEDLPEGLPAIAEPLRARCNVCVAEPRGDPKWW
jgi:hypothetical protein